MESELKGHIRTHTKEKLHQIFLNAPVRLKLKRSNPDSIRID